VRESVGLFDGPGDIDAGVGVEFAEDVAQVLRRCVSIVF
jgi:hypothetical protein